MGKLHTLRRAIERDPSLWRGERNEWRQRPADSAWQRRDGTWSPGWHWSSRAPKPYGAFIKHVLAGVGNADVGGDGERPGGSGE